MDVKYLILLFLLLGCLPEASVTRGNQASTATTSGSSGGTTSTTQLGWNYLGAINSSITINVSNLNNAYIVGSNVESFLGLKNTSGVYYNFTGVDYCLVGRYKLGGIDYELRSRIVPISYYDFTEKRTVRVLRVDFNDVTNSTSYCTGTLYTYNSSGSLIQDPKNLTPIFDPALICPSCTSVLLTSETLRIVQVTTSGLQELLQSTFQVSSLDLGIDPNNNSGSSTGTCSTSTCQSQGYDCCLDNQCVKDGATRPAAVTTYPDDLAIAEQERLQNPLAYLNYPQLYYICGNSIPSTTGGSSGGGYDDAFTQLLKDYNCFTKMKSLSSSTPWTLDLLTTPTKYTNIAECTTASPTGGSNAYQDVTKRLFQTCGCSKTDLSDMINYCPGYEYVVTAYSGTTPTVIDCYTPPTTSPTPSVPIQQTVSVDSRSVPHRFFDTTGAEATLTSASNNQEGDKFEYLDSEKVVPSQTNFSMNAILGQMSVTLDQALPAKTVNVELDQVYYLATTSGYYTPCPSCGKDSWLSSLTAFPSAQWGTGLQTIGHTTERDALSTNTTGGNYEDTIFGRACWVPPTMLPFSHSAKSSTQLQRLNRLKTQAALFANGYQRDWYGFNKGALIGSFDGVTWFAVGKGRIVRASSNKLFLAINAPFADVANSALHVVNVQLYDGITQAAQVDYDPAYSLSHTYQNEAGNCQANHMCNTDAECISRLGWEYTCSDVSGLKTQWPTFDNNSNELASTTTTVGIDQILQQKRLPSSATKRCVYRGAGSLCLVNANSITDSVKKKAMTCAPNFYCASVNSSGVFNSKISRYATALENIPVARNHYFGKDANVLGRPLSYISSSDTTALPSDVRSTLIENLTQYESTASAYTGVCLPGKLLPDSSTTSASTSTWNPMVQHSSSDPSKRTDYISQIGGCNSTLFTKYRYSSCPVIGTDGNYEMFDSTKLLDGSYHLRARSQNACGLDSLLSNTSLAQTASALSNFSPFKLIEGKTLDTQTVVTKSLVRDACLRRAGQVCQTDLDCSPNKMHADQIDYFTTSYFGNDAEKAYHSQYLVCGQAEPKPYSTEAAFQTYDMSKNRCCREVGKDLTTYTSYVPTEMNASNVITYDSASSGLKMSLSTDNNFQNDPARYSRFMSVEGLGTSTRPILSAYREQNTATSLLTTDSTGTNMLTPYQWATLGEANSETCCGGGWIRKFSDGSNDWSKRDRLYLDVANFRCINSRTPLLTTISDLVSDYNSLSDLNSLLNQDSSEYCNDATHTVDGCAEWNIQSQSYETLPVLISSSSDTIYVNTAKGDFTSANLDFYFMPKSADADPNVIMDFSSTTARKNISIKIPSYISRDEFDAKLGSITINLTDSAGAVSGAACVNNAAAFASVVGPTDPGTCGSNCCYKYTSSTRVLQIARNTGASTSQYGVSFSVKRAGNSYLFRTTPGTSTYYLNRLGRLELSGIPQIPHAELYCNDNSDNLVKGIFNLSTAEQNKTSFQTKVNFAFKSGSEYVTSDIGLAVDQVFSANDFKCCTPLGKTTRSMNTCCSGYGIAQGSTYTCGLPSGTNLSVYFNRFVSNEGRATDGPGGGLLDSDFDSQTGEPLQTTSVQTKLSALGTFYCQNGKIRQGGAFGNFEGEPLGPTAGRTLYNIVDSPNDYAQNSNGTQTADAGYDTFMNGFRWNHHLYCDD